jgi:IS4 transposase
VSLYRHLLQRPHQSHEKESSSRHRWNRNKPRTQDGRALRRYRRRWKVERTFAWLGNFRRLVVRYDRSIMIYEAFLHIACFMIVLRRVLKGSSHVMCLRIVKGNVSPTYGVAILALG